MAKVRLYPRTDVYVGTSVLGGLGAQWPLLDDPYNNVNDADESVSVATLNDTTGRVTCTFDACPPVIAIASVTLVHRVKRDSGTGHSFFPFLRIAGTDYAGVTISPNTTYETRTAVWLKNPASAGGALDWTQADVTALQAGWEGWDGVLPASSIRVSMMHLELDCTLAPAAIEAARDLASRRLHRLRRPDEELQITDAPWWLAAYEPLTDLALSHWALPPAGAGAARASRRLVAVTGLRVDLDALQVTQASAVDLRRIRLAHLDGCYSPDDEPSQLAQGVLRLSQGGSSHTRGTKAWAPSPLDGRLVELASEDLQLSRDGLLILNAANQYVPYSSFVNGLTGWAITGAGVGTATIAQDADALYFDVAVVAAGAVRFVAAASPSADLTITSTATPTVAANSTVVLSMAHLDEAAPLCWTLRRTADGQWWNNTTAAWVAAAVWNPWPARTTWTQDQSQPIPVGAAATGFIVRAGVPLVTAVASQRNWLGHVQLELGSYCSPPVVNTGSSVAIRNRDELVLSCNHGRRTWPLEAGSGRARVRPRWSSSALAGGDTRVLLDLTFDATRNARVAYIAGTGWVFQRRVGGVNYQAIAAGTVTAGQVYALAWRWVGPDGELGLPPRSLDIWVDGVRGAQAVAPAGWGVPPAVATVRVGSLVTPTTVGADCGFLHLELLPQVLDLEICDF